MKVKTGVCVCVCACVCVCMRACVRECVRVEGVGGSVSQCIHIRALQPIGSDDEDVDEYKVVL